MAEYIYPSHQFDNAEQLLALLGSMWSATYGGNDLVGDTAFARAQLDVQTYIDTLELLAACSRFKVPVFHKENWYFLQMRESEVNNFAALLALYGEDNEYGPSNSLAYGRISDANTFSVPIPDTLRDVTVILNRITDASVNLVKDVDYWIPRPGVLTFKDNPFANDLIPKRDEFEDGEVTDRLAGLWLFHGDYEWDHIYEQFGYALNLKLESSEGYRDLLNALMDGITQGSKIRDFHNAWSAITGVDLAKEEETIETITEDDRSLVVITDKNVYKYSLNSVLLVTEGQALQPGDPLVDTLQFFELNRGIVPDEIDSVVLGPGLLANGYFSELVWENKEVDVVVEYDAEGYAKVSWELGGFILDVEKFFDDTHERGKASGKTLAHYLDQRPDPIGEPMPESLPATINPLEFLISNFYRFHTFVVKVKPGRLGPDPLPAFTGVHVSQIVPPWTVMIVLVELEYQDEPVIMDGPGDELEPGYTEDLSGFPMMVVEETIDGTSMVSERVRVYQITGKCE